MNDKKVAPVRRVPKQVRSRDRVDRILEVAGDLVISDGVEAVNTRSIAAGAGIPVASLYQYFADKDEILVALVARDSVEMDAQLDEDLAELRTLSVSLLVETSMHSFVKVYRRRPTFVMLRIRGRSNAAVSEFVRAHNQRIATYLFEIARDRGLTMDRATGVHAQLAMEVGDRMCQVAFEHSFEGDPHVIDEGISMLTGYLEGHATPEGIIGIPE